MDEDAIRRVTVVGCGLIGTSVALALRRTGAEVLLHDRDRIALATACRRGAGTVLPERAPRADVVVIATSPSAVADVLRDAQRRDLGRAYTDVASTKALIIEQARSAGCDLATFIPGHPMGGRELSGPAAARADLFAGLRWALCPNPRILPELIGLATELAVRCGATPLRIEPELHDQVAAAVSHLPHAVSSALAARFAAADDTTLSMAGRGLQDVVRIAAGPPALWTEILEQNARHVAPMLDAVARDLTAVAAALRASGPGGSRVLAGLLGRGNEGHANVMAARAAMTAAAGTSPEVSSAAR